tara:strand:- start:4707 stop:5129 length:423 start_codon:yes stop_codon:yes gene_type:complete
MNKNSVIGFTSGVFDLFHVGHVNMLRNASSQCDKLIVGVSTDELVASYKDKSPIIPFAERVEVVRSVRYVDTVVPQESMDKFVLWEKLKYKVMFVGDDWFASKKWIELDQKFKKVGVKIVYFPYTKGISSTLINKILLER